MRAKNTPKTKGRPKPPFACLERRLLEAEHDADAQYIDVGHTVAGVGVLLPLAAKGNSRAEVVAQAHAVSQVEAVLILAEALYLAPGKTELAVNAEFVAHGNGADPDDVPRFAFRRAARDAAKIDIAELHGDALVGLIAAEHPDRGVFVVSPVPVRAADVAADVPVTVAGSRLRQARGRKRNGRGDPNHRRHDFCPDVLHMDSFGMARSTPKSNLQQKGRPQPPFVVVRVLLT